jgi:hypothetical protein
MALAAGLLAFGTTAAKAQGYGGGYYGGGGYGGGGYYGQGYYGGGYGPAYNGGGYGPGYGGGYGVPTQQYYGNGGHDLQPHWHTTQTPVGSFAWYGNGAHDLQPHEHTNSPYGGYRGYSPSPFGGVTTSYYPSTPYTYMPW